MHLKKARTFALVAVAASVGLACAADTGDPSPAAPSGSSSSGVFPGSSSGSSGSPSGGSSSGTPTGSSSSSGSGGSGGGSSSNSSGGSTGSSSSGTGSSSGKAGSSGSSGAGGSTSSSSGSGVDAGSTGCAPTPSKSVLVSFCTNDSAKPTAVQQPSLQLDLGNGGFSTLHLSDITVRYWFTADGAPTSSLAFVSYYSQNVGTNITKLIASKFVAAPAANVTATSDTYLELSFAATAGDLAPLSPPSANIQVVIQGASGQNQMFNETNDYSFNALAKCPAFAASPTITAYAKGVLAYGCEPQAVAGAVGGPTPADGGTGDATTGSSGGADAASGG
jgi:Cellulose binding domain